MTSINKIKPPFYADLFEASLLQDAEKKILCIQPALSSAATFSNLEVRIDSSGKLYTLEKGTSRITQFFYAIINFFIKLHREGFLSDKELLARFGNLMNSSVRMVTLNNLFHTDGTLNEHFEQFLSEWRQQLPALREVLERIGGREALALTDELSYHIASLGKVPTLLKTQRAFQEGRISTAGIQTAINQAYGVSPQPIKIEDLPDTEVKIEGGLEGVTRRSLSISTISAISEGPSLILEEIDSSEEEELFEEVVSSEEEGAVAEQNSFNGLDARDIEAFLKPGGLSFSKENFTAKINLAFNPKELKKMNFGTRDQILKKIVDECQKAFDVVSRKGSPKDKEEMYKKILDRLGLFQALVGQHLVSMNDREERKPIEKLLTDAEVVMRECIRLSK